ncbi:molybdopterin oxidoreductase domain-containing protein [Phthorimaea operculella]|nr:molybdopterin oxidoreductase domain-containing protein [Phthorimaea operculella]
MFRSYRTFNKYCKSIKNIQHLRSASQCSKPKSKVDDDVAIQINGQEVKVPKYFTIMQALRRERVVCPSFCYHERLSIAGNCRMCLVEVQGMFKPQIACAMPVSKGMKIVTNSAMTLRAQESVLEFILADHPLDCPICDQGGECDLQDLTMRFGNDRTRFTEIHFAGKRAVEDKNLGPLIRTSMNRCIHCTRCIRFSSQICGLDVLGTTGRGHDMLVGTYVDKMFLSELSGNVVDLCPVGALTAGPYMFKARPWELKRTNSIDVTDATGTNIVINHRFDRVMRILPREHDEINQEWLSDKGRFAFDSTEMQRILTPMVQIDGCLCAIEWEEALCLASGKIKNAKNLVAVAGPHCNVETLVACKDLLNALGSEQTYIERGFYHTITGADLRCAYSLNIPMKEIAKADKIVLLGTNPRFEAPILNVWIRQAYRTNECDIYVYGPKADYNYFVEYLDAGVENIMKVLKEAKRPLIFAGMDLLQAGECGDLLSGLTKTLKCDPKWPVLNFIPRDASFAGALEVGWVPGPADYTPPDVLILVGSDECLESAPPPGTTVIYVGFQGDKGAQHANLVLPGSAYTEQGGTFVNMECRPQYALPAVTPPGKARYDWKIFRALAEYCDVNLFYDNQDSLEYRMSQISPALVSLDTVQEKMYMELLKNLMNREAGAVGPITVEMKRLQDYYISDIFSCNSPTMVEAYKAACAYDKSPYARN